jgi:hypothetical protein
MSGPDGSVTRRDERRNQRRAQFEAQQAERRRVRQRKIQQQRLQRYTIIAVSIVVFLIVAFLIVHAVIGSGGAPVTPHHGLPTTTPRGDSWWDPVPFDLSSIVSGYAMVTGG